jgi:hypothetical protein
LLQSQQQGGISARVLAQMTVATQPGAEAVAEVVVESGDAAVAMLVQELMTNVASCFIQCDNL